MMLTYLCYHQTEASHGMLVSVYGEELVHPRKSIFTYACSGLNRHAIQAVKTMLYPIVECLENRLTQFTKAKKSVVHALSMRKVKLQITSNNCIAAYVLVMSRCWP